MKCKRCEGEAVPPAHYCPGCIEWFKSNARFADKKANPAPGVHCTGRFNLSNWCPRTFANAELTANVCGLCGSDNLMAGYGFAGGYGLGTYNWCHDCETVLDHSPDSGE